MLLGRRHLRRLTLLSGASVMLAAVSAALTLTNAGMYDGAMPSDMIIGALGFDIMSLVVALATGACLLAINRGDDRAWLLWSGLQGYLLYAYALYAFDFVSTPLYLAYVAIVGLSAYAFGTFVRSLNVDLVASWHPARLPRRAMAFTLFTMAGMFAAAWTYMLLGAALGTEVPPPSTIIVMDLALTLPLLVVVATMLARHQPLGDFLAPGVFTLSAAITLGVALGEVLRPAHGQKFELAAAAPYLLPGTACLAFAVIAYARVAGAMPRGAP